jgi:hypothetical protein
MYRTFLPRLCGVAHVMFHVLNCLLNGEDPVCIPEEVGVETARTVEQVVKYFANQRKVINKVINCMSHLIYNIL